MKKILHIPVFILLLSLSSYGQERVSGSDLYDNLATHNLYGQQQPIPIDRLSENSFYPKSVQNEEFLLIWRYKMIWDFSESVWEHDMKVFYTYDGFDNLAESFESWTDGSGPYGKSIYFYDVNHNLEEERVYKHNGSEWENSYKYLYNYDGNSHLVQRTRQTWNNDLFENEVKDTYVYNANNQKIYQMMYYWQDDDWVESQKFDFQYDGNSNLYSVLSEAWINNAWVNWQKSIYAWDTTGNLQSIVSSKWDLETSVWLHPHNKQYYSYDLDNNRIISVIQHWYVDGEYWINDFKSTYYYVPTESKTVEYKSSGINKPINDLQTTEDDIIIEPGKDSKPLIGVEFVIDTVLHTSVGDLEFTLSHNGVNQKLISSIGGDSDHFIGTTLSDFGVDTLAAGIAPFYGIYKPGNPLSLFVGTNPSGKWTLSIYDGKAVNTGSLVSWGLNLIYGSGSTNVNVSHGKALFEIFPNPTWGKLKIISSPNSIRISRIEILDLYGKRVVAFDPAYGTRAHLHAGLLELNISHLPEGIYLVRLYTNNQMIVKKILKI